MENILQTIRDFSSHFVQGLLDLFALPPPSHHRAAVPGAAIVWRQGLCPLLVYRITRRDVSHGAAITVSATSQLSVQSPLSERAQAMPAGRADAKGFVIKRLQRTRGMARGYSPCDRR